MNMKSNRGYFGIGIYMPKTEQNIGTLWRSAFCFGASYIFTIGRRYKKQCSDTVQAFRHIPLIEYPSFQSFIETRPMDAQIVAIENCSGAKEIGSFCHPERAIYLLGAEDNGIPTSILEQTNHTIILPGRFCLNVSVAGSIVMFDRLSKRT